MGEWDAQNSELFPSQEYSVSRIFVHPSYSSVTLSNSIAILRLSPNVPLGQLPTITTGCLSSNQISGMRCWVSGWGQSSFTSASFQSIQNQVDVPLIDQTSCENQLRTTRLGSSFTLDRNSFMCAGGEAGKDAVSLNRYQIKIIY
jgi:secreted trypsin-like serine protease